MAFDVASFLANGLTYGGARPSKFDVFPTIPSALIGVIDPSSAAKFQFTCRAASIPAFTLGMAPIPYFGRIIKSSGDRTWADWQVMVMLDEDYNTRAMMEAWNNSINALNSNVMDSQEDNSSQTTIGAFTDENFKTNWNINHYGKDGSQIRQYTLIGAWPREVGAMQLNWESTNQISEFSCIISFDSMVPSLEGAKGNQTTYADLV
jgi:hypothetical protein